MAGGYPSLSPEPMAGLARQITELRERVARLEMPTGTSLSNLVEQVQAALVNLAGQVEALVAQYVSQYSYTKAEVNNLVNNPGNINPANVNASGRVSSNGAPLTSVPSRNYLVTSNYVAGWIQSDGQIGYVPSSLRFKTDLEPMDDAEVGQLMLSLVPRWGRYVWDGVAPEQPIELEDGAVVNPIAPAPGEAEALKAFLIAEEVDALGIYGADVVPVDVEGRPDTINYSHLVPGLVATLRYLAARLDRLEGTDDS